MRWRPAFGTTAEFALAAAAVCAPGRSAGAQTVTWPARTWHDVQFFPRVHGLPDRAVERRVNSALAWRDRKLRADRRECAADAREGARINESPFRGIDFTQSVRVAHLSPRFLSLEVHRGWYCGGPYPTNDSPQPVTYDLTTGREVDWSRALARSALAMPDTRTDDEPDPSPLAALYERHYPREGSGPDPDCAGAALPNADFVFWLGRDARGRVGLAVQPQLPHVVEACAETVVLSGADARRFVASPALRAEFGR